MDSFYIASTAGLVGIALGAWGGYAAGHFAALAERRRPSTRYRRAGRPE